MEIQNIKQISITDYLQQQGYSPTQIQVAVGGIAAAAVFHTEYQPAVGCFGEGGIGLEHFHRRHGDDVAAAVGDGLAAEDGFVQQGRLNFGFVGGFRSELIWASNLSSRYYEIGRASCRERV